MRLSLDKFLAVTKTVAETVQNQWWDDPSLHAPNLI